MSTVKRSRECVALCLLVPALLLAQPSRKLDRPGWAAASLGVGSLKSKYSSTSTAAADLSAGVSLPYRLGVGGQVLRMRTVRFMSDQPDYSTSTLLAVLRYRPVAGAALLLGGGRMTFRELDSQVRTSSTVVHVAAELYLPSRSLTPLRLLAAHTWAPASGNPMQTQVGVGIVFR